MPALDGLRGVAILMVILTHAGGGWRAALSIVHDTSGADSGLALPHWLETISNHAFLGVALFFVVSAFTLTVRAANDGGGLRSYALRRIARVGPGYWIAGLVYTLAVGLGPRLTAPAGIEPGDVLSAALFASSWLGGPSYAVVPGGWSISCEVAFYIALPFLIRVIDGRIWRAVFLTVLWMALTQLRVRHAMHDDVNDFFFNTNPIQQAPIFLCGITAALIATRYKLALIPGLATALLVIAIAVLPFQPIPSWHLLPHLPFAVLMSVVVALSAAHPPVFLASRALRRIGEVSYSMYLIHFGILAVSLRAAGVLCPTNDWRTMLLHFVFTVAVTFAFACITYRVIERPAIRWAARRTVPARSTVTASAD